MTRPDQDKEYASDQSRDEVPLSKETLEDLDASDEGAEDAKGGAAPTGNQCLSVNPRDNC